MDAPRFLTVLGTSTRTDITLLGRPIQELMGSVSLTELTFWMVTERRPSAGQVRVLDACLVALADHGFTPTAIATRMTWLSAPDSVQGAMAAGLLGGGSRFLGVTEDCGGFLHRELDRLESYPDDDRGWDEVARDVVTRARAERLVIPGIGHPRHKDGDPRTPRLMALAAEEDTYGPHLSLFAAIGRVHPEVLGRTLPLNGAGVVGAALADLDLPISLLRGFALLARAAGLLAQLAEEQRRPMAMDTYLLVDHAAEPIDPATAPDAADADADADAEPGA